MWINYLYYPDILYPINIEVILKHKPFEYFTIPFIHHLDTLNISK